ncbi:MAG: chorismate-binding protein [Spirochaetaceae bacterium]|jgi:para-aminobenzoate synthetase/4-amino-4-deoxychorismate lyase|nr:chorismate-binding protein [Spirochaetaceae bacterium]
MAVYGDYLFQCPARIIAAFNNTECAQAFREIEALKDRCFLLGYVRYEARGAFAGVPVQSPLPLVYFEAFERAEPYIPRAPRPFVLNPEPSLAFGAYQAALREIREEIAEGNTYEVNYTYDFTVDHQGRDPFELYEYLLSKQKTPYNAFIANEYDTVLSFSPELFFEIEQARGERHIRTKPMKGTVKRGANPAEDAGLVDFLRKDLKNRAENVMIVDLLRNDLGRIAKTGSVAVTRLFEIETHPTLHQMTSQIEADLQDGVSLYDVFKALFPCGSVTGAPKISTMNIIDRLEKGKRHIYCGAVGFIRPGGAMTFSVPIRILQKTRDAPRFACRVGGAVVWDSGIADEWKETLTKTRFLRADFFLLETMRVENGIILFEEAHIRRLKTSAAYFGFALDDSLFPLKPERDGILRLTVDKQGRWELEYREMQDSPAGVVSVSPVTVDSGDPLLYHKTSCRPYYQHVDYRYVYDELFFNERGELTEGSRTNIILETGGKRYTPPVSCGLLDGIYRRYMLDKGECEEKILFKEDIGRSDRMYCVNSVRGLKEVALHDTGRHGFTG